MALANTPAVNCQSPLGFEDLLKQCILKDSDGNIFLNIAVITPSGIPTPLIGCQTDMGLEGLLQQAFVLDDDGNVALQIGNNS